MAENKGVSVWGVIIIALVVAVIVSVVTTQITANVIRVQTITNPIDPRPGGIYNVYNKVEIDSMLANPVIRPNNWITVGYPLVDKVTIEQRKNGEWVALKENAKVGDLFYIGDISFKITDINTLQKTVTFKNGDFSSKRKYVVSMDSIPEYITFDDDVNRYIVIKKTSPSI